MHASDPLFRLNGLPYRPHAGQLQINRQNCMPPSPPPPPSRRRDFFCYGFGLLCTFIGAWLTAVTGSMLPLALGSSAGILCAVPLVKSLWTKKR